MSTLSTIVAGVRMAAKYLDAYGLGPETQTQISKLLKHRPGEMSGLVAIQNDATRTLECRSHAAKLLMLLGQLYRYGNPHDAPDGFIASGAASESKGSGLFCINES